MAMCCTIFTAADAVEKYEREYQGQLEHICMDVWTMKGSLFGVLVP